MERILLSKKQIANRLNKFIEKHIDGQCEYCDICTDGSYYLAKLFGLKFDIKKTRFEVKK